MRGSHSVLAGSLLLLALLGSGCLTPEQIVSLQKDVSDMRGQMDALRKENKEAADQIASMKAIIQSREEGGREQSAETKRQFEAIRDDIRTVSSRIEELQHRLIGLSPSPGGAVPRSPIPPAALPGEQANAVSPSPAERGPEGSPEELFNGAYADYSKGNYAPAILGFEAYSQRNPGSEKADDALYWIGLCHYDQGEYAEAISQFDKLIQQFPTGDKVAGAHLKKGLSLLEMNRTAQGVVQLQYLIEHFGRTEEARIARDRLREIGVKP